jgi:hypothetical protein
MGARSESSLTRGAIFTFGRLPRSPFLIKGEGRERETAATRPFGSPLVLGPCGSSLRPGILELRDPVSATRYIGVRWKFSAGHRPERHRHRKRPIIESARREGILNLPPLIVREAERNCYRRDNNPDSSIFDSQFGRENKRGRFEDRRKIEP